MISATRAARCTCGEGRGEITRHGDDCALFDCDACGAKVIAGEDHAADCPDRCPHCGSEGRDLDHCAGCPTIGTCAQMYPWMPREEGWHFDPPHAEAGTLMRWHDGTRVRWTWSEWIDEHMRTVHPDVRTWRT